MPEETEACSEFLTRQIAAINPRLIVTLGRFSMARYFPGARISAIHGQGKEIDGRKVVAMYHPAAALHQPSLRAIVEADFARLPTYLAGATRPAAIPADPSDAPQQLNLF